MQVKTITILGYQYAYDSVRNPDNASVQALLAGCHGQAHLRPLCNCKEAGIPLQIRRIGNIYHLARMPEDGLSHAETCGFYGETEHAAHAASGENLRLGFSLNLTASETDGEITLSGLLNQLWTRARLNQWSQHNKPRSWKYVAEQIYAATRGLKLNGVSASRLLWVMPSMDESQVSNMYEGCMNFIKSCNASGRYALLIAPVGASEYQDGASCLRFRVMERPPVYIEYRHFPFKTYNLKEHGEYPYPVAIMLARVPDGKQYLRAADIAMLWMTPSYLPCATKERSVSLKQAMQTSEFISVPLSQDSGQILDITANIRKNGRLEPMFLTEPSISLPWSTHARKS